MAQKPITYDDAIAYLKGITGGMQDSPLVQVEYAHHFSNQLDIKNLSYVNWVVDNRNDLSLSQFLRALRIANGYTTSEAAKKCGSNIPANSITGIEKGRRTSLDQYVTAIFNNKDNFMRLPVDENGNHPNDLLGEIMQRVSHYKSSAKIAR